MKFNKFTVKYIEYKVNKEFNIVIVNKDKKEIDKLIKSISPNDKIELIK